MPCAAPCSATFAPGLSLSLARLHFQTRARGPGRRRTEISRNPFGNTLGGIIHRDVDVSAKCAKQRATPAGARLRETFAEAHTTDPVPAVRSPPSAPYEFVTARARACTSSCVLSAATSPTHLPSNPGHFCVIHRDVP